MTWTAREAASRSAGRGQAVLVLAVAVAAGSAASCKSKTRRAGEAAASARTAPSARQEGLSGPFAYVGTATCSRCHADEAKRFFGSHHDRAMEEPTDASVLGDFSGVRFVHAGETTEFVKSGDGFAVRVVRKGEKARTLLVKYTFGFEPLQQYLVDVGGGRLQALSVAWDARPKSAGGQRWFHLHADEKSLAPGDRLHWESPAYNWNSMCADCHSTGVEQNYRRETDRYETRFAGIDVGCEACHGRGSRHVAWAEARVNLPPDVRRHDASQRGADKGLQFSLVKPDGRRWVLRDGQAIASLEGSSADDAELERCAPCHSRRSDLGPGAGDTFADRYRLALLDDELYFPDGQIRDEVFELGSFLQSRMHARGVVCSDCHEPHSLSLRAEGNALCATCHRASRYDTPDHHFHAGATTAAQCVACHMPARTYMSIDPRRDHGFSLPRPAFSAKIGAPDACTGCHSSRSASWAEAEIRKRRGAESRKPALGDALWLARRGQPGAVQSLLSVTQAPAVAPILRASALAELAREPSAQLPSAIASAVTDADPLVRRTAALAARSLRPSERIELIHPLLGDAIRTVRVEAFAALLDAPAAGFGPEASSQLKRAHAEYVASREYRAAHAEGLVDLADLSRRSGDAASAERLLREAIRREPSFSAAHLNFADLFRERGEEERARETLKAGLARASDRAMLEHALGLAFVRAKRTDSALEHLGAAYRAGPDRVELGYVYAIALFDTGKQQESLEVLTKLHEQHPGNRSVLAALVDYSRRSNRIEQADAYERKLAALSAGTTP